MVRQKQRSRSDSNFQAKKKVFEVDNGNGSDFEEEMPIQKTPQNKTPKGNQSMSGRKVSIELPGKTPQKNISLLAKKHLRPAGKEKTAIQEFKGMKRNKAVQEEEDDDDDEDDDDFELDMDDDDSDEDADVVDEEEQGLTQKQKKSNAKQQEKVLNQLKKTPVKGAENSKGPQTPKDKTPKDERDAKSLYVGNIPKDVTMDMLKDLSPDIVDVRMNPGKDGTSYMFRYAFLEFPSEDIAESNYKTLHGKKLQGQLINIGYVGKKRSGLSGNTENKMYSTKLHVSGIPLDTSIADVAVHFPTAVSFLFPSLISNKPKLYRTAIINVGDEKSANKACNSKIEVKGQTLNIRCFNEKRKWFRKSGHQGRNPAKKMKF